jgi:hypothetical protein
MTPGAFDDAVRNLGAIGTRRQMIAAICAAVIAALTGDASSARRVNQLRKRNTKRDGDRRDRKKRKKGRKRKKHKKSKSNDCKAKNSEQEILGFIKKAAKKYGQSYNAMVRVARCESALDPCAYNKSGPYYGLYQFLKSTWKTTPYGGKSIYDPKAQAFAAGWMWKQGRKNEWACQ